MSTTAELLAAEFTHGEVRQFQGRGGQTFDYIEDETVMDRLDAVLGVGSWSIEVEPIGIADGIVKVRLSGTTPDGKAFRHEDFGYASNAGPQAEGLKEAVSDGIRRCGRYLGVGRYLYKKHGPTRAAAPARPPVARPVAPRPRAVPNAPDELSEEDVDALFAASPNATGGGTPPAASGSDNSDCPIHGVTWNGSWGDLWHKTPDGVYCRHPENIARRAGAR